ncbi:hypothetical protein [Nocardia blacklockiae]|uniref:hypothetical protein n=1 Tax=Nocardia blacklockiae TaxID=480036 RepID=UPI001892EA90|nr:hypothetical protein [Nocardia blacklockiae]MBF6176006.1 hypothetical protein [Nocardia blacklockiae]
MLVGELAADFDTGHQPHESAVHHGRQLTQRRGGVAVDLVRVVCGRDVDPEGRG